MSVPTPLGILVLAGAVLSGSESESSESTRTSTRTSERPTPWTRGKTGDPFHDDPFFNPRAAIAAPSIRTDGGSVLFNINDEIQVKLNDKGREIYLHAFDDVPEQFRRVRLPEEDAEGYSKFQMWVFMQIFGPHINMGFGQPFDLTIKFNPKDFHE